MFKIYIKKFIIFFAPGAIFWLRKLKVYYTLSRNPIDIEKGFKFVGNSEMMSGNFEPGETAIFENTIKHVDVLINVGANVGYYCCIALKQNKKVVAFEPMPGNIKALLKNIFFNNWQESIEVFPLALSDKAGVLEIFGEGTGASLIKGWAGMGSKEKNLISASTLDLVLGKRFTGKKCLIMVDVEGAEYFFLKGAREFLNMSPKPIWLMEISIRAQQPKGVKINPNLIQTFEFFWSRGYNAYTTHNSHRLVNKDEVERIINGGEDTLYGDTFLFIDDGVH